MAAFVQANFPAWRCVYHITQHLIYPWSRGIHHNAREYFIAARRIGFLHEHAPHGVLALCRCTARARVHAGAAFRRIDRIHNHQPCIIDAAVRIFEAAAISALQRRADRIVRQIQIFRSRQCAASAEMIVKPQSGAQNPGRAQTGMVGQDETPRPYQMPLNSRPGRTIASGWFLLTRLWAKAVHAELYAPCAHFESDGAESLSLGPNGLVTGNDSPRPAASRAIPQPLIPPPMIARS